MRHPTFAMQCRLKVSSNFWKTAPICSSDFCYEPTLHTAPTICYERLLLRSDNTKRRSAVQLRFGPKTGNKLMHASGNFKDSCNLYVHYTATILTVAHTFTGTG